MQYQERSQATYLLLAFLCLLVQNVSSAPRSDPLVSTNVGVFRGVQATDGDYAMFTGIPFAIVDEKNPFGAAIPHPGFDDVFEANRESNLCPQLEEVGWQSVGTLDCLQLNVYVPNSVSSSSRLPVMVWIYGGGFAVGDNGQTFYGPSYLVRHDVILVTVNYRVGPYGFMCLHTPQVPGNQGLKDQRIALKWIKNNIEAFGGDTDRITLFGQSAGAASVEFQLIYNEEMTFDGVIFQSGQALGPWGYLEPDLAAPIKLANQLGFETNNIEDALSFLSKTDPLLVIGAYNTLGFEFRTCVEKDFDNVDKFMGNYPINTGISKNNYSMLIGHNNDESYAYRFFSDIEFLRGLIRKYLGDVFNFNEDELNKNEQLIKQFYMGEADINEETKQGIVDFDADFIFNYPVVRSIPKFLANGANSIYQYVFSYNGERNVFLNLVNSNSGKATHGDEIGYLFTQTYNKAVTPSCEDQLMIDRITTLWTNFAKYRNPTPAVTDLLPIIWTPVTEDSPVYMNIDKELSIQRGRFRSNQMAFWELFYEENERRQKDYQEGAL